MARTKTPSVGGKQKYVKKLKSERGNRKGWMDGLRAKIFLPLVPKFADTVDTGWQAADEYMKGLQNLYHFHFPYPMKDTEEPSELKDYDPLKVVPDDDSALSDDENKHGLAAMAYTYEILMARLAGATKAPKQPHASHIFRRENKDTGHNVDKAIAEKWATVADKKSKLPKVTFRNEVARDMLKALPKEEQKKYEKMAKEEGTRKKEKYQTLLTSPPSRAPEDRAAAVANLENFLGDINRGCEERTFMRLFTLAGGPTSEANGEISTKSYSTSKNSAPIPLSFQEWLGPTELAKLLGQWAQYLETCYSAEERQCVVIPDVANVPAPAQSNNIETAGAALHGPGADVGPGESVDTGDDVVMLPMEAASALKTTTVGGKMVTAAALEKLLSMEDSDDDSSESGSDDKSDSDSSDAEFFIPQDNDEVLEQGKKKKKRKRAGATPQSAGVDVL
ncbi:hypothetical protein BDZ89DRAFT_1146588 [Hymenopellis radicata]|nr:hypothetical protein BDZ89DRAFT_1146588 [Hymenopellis radicata]